MVLALPVIGFIQGALGWQRWGTPVGRAGWMDDEYIAGKRKHHNNAFHFAMASMAADGGPFGAPTQWPFGFPRASHRRAAFARKHYSATFPIKRSRGTRLTQPSKHWSSKPWIIKHR